MFTILPQSAAEFRQISGRDKKLGPAHETFVRPEYVVGESPATQNLCLVRMAGSGDTSRRSSTARPSGRGLSPEPWSLGMTTADAIVYEWRLSCSFVPLVPCFPGPLVSSVPALTIAIVPPDSTLPIILAENLTKTYAAGRIQVTAVRGISLSIERGEFVAIVGPSGSGKSTLFYLLGGLTRATEGRVVIDGVDFALLNDGERTRLRKHRIGFVFQRFNLLPTLSGLGNIEIAYAISGRKEPMDQHYLDHLSEMLAIRGRLDHRPSELSGGEQQRIAIARALITRPAIVLADEPTGNLDTMNSDAVLDMLVRSNRELGQTTLMITHNPEAAAVAGRILHMRDGQIVKEEAGSGLTAKA
jgi:putative ABC transport system ATP-binding protein